MRVIFVYLLVFLLTSGCAFGSTQDEETKEEQGPYFWDFGQVAQGDILEHTFVLINDSSIALEINEVRTSCGCTTSEVRRKKILPGESAEVPVKFKTQGYSGIKKQYVYIHTNQENNPLIKLTLKADIQTAHLPE